MRVLIVTQTYLPEMGAPSNRLYPIVRKLVELGHHVLVATGMPNYPEGIVFPAYRGKQFQREEMDGYAVLRTLFYTVPRNQSKITQFLSYLSFVPAALRSGLAAGPVDVVFVTSPPLFVAIPGIWLARLRRARIIFDIRDLWPDEIVGCGAAREESLPVRFMRLVERWVYRSADCMTCTTQAFIDTIAARGVDPARTALIPNGADLELFGPLAAENPVADKFGFGGSFVVMYSGLLGIKHGLEALLDAAERLLCEPDIQFCLVGTGARRQALQDDAERRKLTNVKFLGEQPLADLPYLLARSNVCISTLLPDEYLHKIISVKIFEYMACEKPVIAAQAGEGARVVSESGGGIVVPPGDGVAIADAIVSLYRDPGRCAEMGKSGRAHVESRYSRSVSAANLEKVMLSLVERRSPTVETVDTHSHAQ